jgi:hypothetical protein
MNKTNTGPRYLRLQRYWFENQASTQHVSTWADICNSLRIDDEPEDIETIALKVSITTYRVPVHGTNTQDIRILE